MSDCGRGIEVQSSVRECCSELVCGSVRQSTEIGDQNNALWTEASPAGGERCNGTLVRNSRRRCRERCRPLRAHRDAGGLPPRRRRTVAAAAITSRRLCVRWRTDHDGGKRNNGARSPVSSVMKYVAFQYVLRQSARSL